MIGLVFHAKVLIALAINANNTVLISLVFKDIWYLNNLYMDFRNWNVEEKIKLIDELF